jgi:spermidine synthase
VESAGSGLASLAYEVAWNRALILSIGSSIQALTLILSAFILGLALGSAVGSRLADRTKDPAAGLAFLQSAVGVSAIALLPLLGHAPLWVAGWISAPGRTFGAVLAWEFVLIEALLLIPVTILGAVFPFACRLAAGSQAAIGRTVGAVYSWNTLGSIAGTILASFALVPTIGIPATIRAAAALNLGLSALLLARGAALGKKLAWVPLGALILVALVPGWSAGLMASGSYLYGRSYAAGARATHLSLQDYIEQDSPPLAEYWDSYGLASIHRQGSVLSLRINGKVDASTGELDNATQLLIGHLPFLYHPSPHTGLVIGLGGGFTLGAVARHPIEKIECVEISSAVVRAAAHFSQATGDPLSHPDRIRLIEGDGRNFVQFSKKSYDIIISQPSNLWVSGMANLFTLEFFEKVRSRLTPGGVYSHWVYASRLEEQDFRQVLRTFYWVFPHGSLWEVQPGGDYILLGSADPPAIRWADFESRAKDPAVMGQLMDPAEPAAMALIGHFLTDASGARAVAGPGPLLTDDRMTIEFTAPRGLFLDTRAGILGLLESERAKPVGEAAFAGVDSATAQNIARRRKERASFAASVAAYWREDFDQALALLESSGQDRQVRAWREDLLESLLRKSAQNVASGDLPGALRMLGRIPPSSAAGRKAQLEIARILLKTGHREEARRIFREALSDPGSEFDSTLALATLAEEEGRWTEAEAMWRNALRLRPRQADLRLRLAASLLQEGRLREARQVCLEALQVEPSNLNARRILEAIDQR